MRALRSAVLLLSMLALAACGNDAAPEADSRSVTPVPAPAAAAPTAASLDTAALRERASASLAANRLYAPAGDNAVEDYLALRERAANDPAVESALVDLAPYVMIGAEQATAAEDFAEATRLIDLLARMDPDAPAVPRLREALAGAQATADARAAAELAEAEAQTQRRIAEEEQRAAEAAAPPAPAPARSASTSPAARAAAPAEPAPAPARPAARPVASAPAATTPPSASAPAAAARALVHRVAPRFPEAATRRRLEGEVELSVRIRADGIVDSVEVVRATPPGVFDREAVLAVRRWRYAPADAPSQAGVVLRFNRP